MGSGVPLLNEYKQEFLWKRLPQTVLGGPKLRLSSDAPAYVYLSQVVLFLGPWAVAATLTTLVHFRALRYDAGVCVEATLAFVCVIAVNAFSEYKSRSVNAVAAMSSRRSQQNVLAEEDEVRFSSPCAVKTVRFVAPGKKYPVNIVVHAALSAVLCGLGFWYLLPVTLNALFADRLGVTLVLHVLGWFTVCVAQYSLAVAAPPETASYGAEDPLELAPITRPFYCLLCFGVDLLARYHSSSGLLVANQAGHVLFVTLPLLWTVGLLSPLTAFFMWLVEQTVISIFGGSAMTSDLRSVVMLLMSTCSFLLAYLTPHGLATTALMAALGYVLSLDLSSLAASLLRLTRSHKKPKPNEVAVPNHFLWRWSLRELVFHGAMLLVAGGLAVTLNLWVAPSAGSIGNQLLYGVIVLLVLEHLLTDLQGVYFMFGFWRNFLFPGSSQRTTVFHKGKRRLEPVGSIRRVLRNFVAPLLMLSWLAVTFTFPDTSPFTSLPSNITTTVTNISTNITNISTTVTNVTSTISPFDYTAAHLLGVHRTYRWIWQNTVACLLDLSLYQLLRLALPASAGWRALPVGVQLLLVTLARDRGEQLLQKLYFYITLSTTAWTDKKQRRRATGRLLVANLLLCPLVLGVLVLATALSSPLLPLFTLPVFLVGYPRPWRGWPGAVGESANTCADTVYYRHLAPRLAVALRAAAARGSIGEAVVGGHYLVRFQDRLAWVQVLELGYLYMCISIKGLELQETSCHTVEATRIDDIFEETFEPTGGTSCCTWNAYPLSVLRPYDTTYVKTYSDARNQLTGVIDSPESLRLIADSFVQGLVWILLKHCHEEKQKMNQKVVDLQSRSSSTTKTPPPQDIAKNSISNWGKLDIEVNAIDMLSVKPNACSRTELFTSSQSMCRKSTATIGDDDDLTFDDTSPDTPANQQTQPKKSLASLRSLTDSWVSDTESLSLEELDRRKPNLVRALQLELRGSDDTYPITLSSPIVLPPLKVNLSQQQLPPVIVPSPVSGGVPSVHDAEEVGFGMPAVEEVTPVSFRQQVAPPRGNSRLLSVYAAAALQSPLATPPLHWHDAPIQMCQLTPLLPKFPKAWYRHIVSLMQPADGEDGGGEEGRELALEEVYMRLVMTCYGIVNVLGTLGVTDVASLGPTHVHKVYNGNIPWSPSLAWLEEDKQLFTMVIKAFRYGVKLAIDQVLLGEVTSLEDLQAYMEEYDNDYYIGLEVDPGWAEAILNSTPNLFSLNYIPTQGTFTSRVLTLQDVPVHIGSVSSEAVRAQWANLALELFYMTNDDEERNSIQAHATLLRNLTVQAADPPLGYPVYASAPVSLPTL